VKSCFIFRIACNFVRNLASIACTLVGHLWEVAWEEEEGLNLVEYIGLAVFLVAFAVGVSVVANYVPPDERPKVTIKNRVRRFKPTAKEED